MDQVNTSSAYQYGQNLYLNLTERCPTDCTFCIKNSAGRRFHGSDLSLEKDPEVDEVWADILEHTGRRLYDEFVFCGYGESTYRLGVVLEITRRLKHRYPRSYFRLNTVGLAGAIWHRDIVPELAAAGLTSVNVSLNTADPVQWLKLHRPRAELRSIGFESVLDFVRSCVLSDLLMTVTAVDLPGVDIPAVRNLASSLGASFLARPPLTAREAAA